jgi:hypothetical protein
MNGSYSDEYSSYKEKYKNNVLGSATSKNCNLTKRIKYNLWIENLNMFYDCFRSGRCPAVTCANWPGTR